MFSLLESAPSNAGPPVMPQGETPYNPDGSVKSSYSLEGIMYNAIHDLQSWSSLYQISTNRDDLAEEQFWVSQLGQDGWRDRLKARLQESVNAINEDENAASNHFTQFMLKVNTILSGAVSAFSTIAGFAARPTSPTYEELEGLGIYADQWGTLLNHTRADMVQFKVMLLDGLDTVKDLRNQILLIVAKIGESYEATISDLNAKIARLEAFIDQLVAENQKLLMENARLKKELSKWKIDLQWPEVQDPTAALEKFGKYLLIGIGGLVALKALGIVKKFV